VDLRGPTSKGRGEEGDRRAWRGEGRGRGRGEEGEGRGEREEEGGEGRTPQEKSWLRA